MKAVIARFLKDQSAATAIEYALIAGVIGLGIVISLGAIGTGLLGIFNNTADKLK